MPGEDDDPQLVYRLSELQGWRHRQALRAGLNRVEARLFAESDIDIAELYRLVRLRCPPELLAKVLL